MTIGDSAPQASIEETHDLARSLASSLTHQIGVAMIALVALWQISSLVLLSDTASRQSLPSSILVVLSSLLAMKLASIRPSLASISWQIGLAAAIVLGAWLLGWYRLMLCFCLLPMIAVFSGFSAEPTVVSVLLLLAAGSMHRLTGSSLWQYWAVSMLLGLAGAGIGWIVRRAYMHIALASDEAYGLSRQQVREARQSQLALKEAQEDAMAMNAELIRLSDRLKVLSAAADEARQAKESFVANVSHELRTPLNMIIGFAEMIPESSQAYGLKLPAPLLADISAIRRNSQHLASLVDDVLDLSQIEGGRMVLAREWAVPGEIVQDAVSSVRPLFHSKGLYLRTDVSDDLPELYCDVTRLRQVVLNLVSNAGRFTTQGGVTVGARQVGESVHISVVDTGPGIPYEDMDRIFEPFQQLDDSIRRKHGGSGLGLAISRELVELHGGRLWIEDSSPGGSTFALSIPVYSPSRSQIQGRANRWFSPYIDYELQGRHRPSRVSVPPLPRRVLVLGQDETLSRLLMRYLDDAEISIAADEQEALGLLEHHIVDAIIQNQMPSDVSQPTIANPQLPPQGVPLLRCTIAGEQEAASRLGVVSYMLKPIKRDELLSAIRDLGGEIKRIMLVDDDAEILQLFSRVIASSGTEYTVMRAKGAKRALDLMRVRKPDLVLLDLVMPGMDGMQLLEAMRADPAIADIPVIIVSSTDPMGHPILANQLSITYRGGLSIAHLLRAIESAPRLLGLESELADPALPESLLERPA